MRGGNFVKVVNDNLLFLKVRPVIFIKAGSILQIFFVEVQGQPFTVLIQVESFPGYGEIFIPDSRESTEIQNGILNLAILLINDKIFDGSEILAISRRTLSCR